MACPHCGAITTTEQTDRTALGYRKFRCYACKRLFNERTGTPFNFLEYPTDIVLLVIVWRVRYKLSLRDFCATSAAFQPCRKSHNACQRRASGFCRKGSSREHSAKLLY